MLIDIAITEIVLLGGLRRNRTNVANCKQYSKVLPLIIFNSKHFAKRMDYTIFTKKMKGNLQSPKINGTST